VRARLLLAFFGISAFAVLAAAAGIYAFREVGNRLELVDMRVPPTLTSLALSRSAERIIAAAPALLAATDRKRRDEVKQELAAEVDRLNAKLLDLKLGGTEALPLLTMEPIVAALMVNLAALEDLVAQRLEANERLKVLQRGVFQASEETQRLLAPWLMIMEGQLSAVRADLQKAKPDNAADAARQLSALMQLQSATQTAQRQFSAAVDMLAEASTSDQERRLPVLAFQISRVLRDLEATAGALDPKLRPLFLEQVAKLRRFVDGSDSITEARKQELAFIGNGGKLLNENATLSAQLTAAVDQLASAAQTDIDQATRDALSVQRHSTRILIALVALSLLSSILIVWLYVGRNIVRRLTALSDGMLAIAGGRLQAPILATGSDEIAAMGRAVEVFRKNTLERDDLLVEKAQAADRLEREVKERTRELAQSIQELRALGEVSQAVNSTIDLQIVLTTIVAKATQLSSTDAGAIYVYDEKKREFHLPATYGMDEAIVAAIRSRPIRMGETAVGEAVAQRRPLQIADVQNDQSSLVLDVIVRAGFRALLFVPLLGHDRIVGALVVRRREPGEFPPSTIDLMQTFAAQSVVAIENARLFGEIEEKGRQLAVASEHKSQFLANMSHELRTPLNAIIGYSEILQEEVEDIGQPRLIDDLRRIEQSGRHLLGLINGILDLSKIEAGRMELFVEDVEIAPLLEEVRAIIAPLAEKNGNVLEFRQADDLSTMRTDRTKLKQSLLNILSNGAKFTHNGRLNLLAERVVTDRPMVRFVISDSGIGMTDEQLGRLFQAFSQADASTTKKYGGTGLGLVITRQFCQLLGGDINVESRPGEGSTFTITLPGRVTTATPTEAAEAPRIAADMDYATTVLVVDDDPTARDLLSANLKGAGYRLIHAASGEEALNLARKMRPDAITLDVVMPKMDGWAVLSALKADPALRDIPVVMVTVSAERGLGLSLGAVDVLTKPVDRADLLSVLHRLLRREGPILLVEDDANTRALIRHAIDKMGLPVAEAVDGSAALAWLVDNPVPALILLDLMMPEMDGFEFLDAIATRAEWRDIPVIVITAKELTPAERERLLRESEQVIVKRASVGVDIAAAVGEAVRRRPAPAAVTERA
jgi:signal transduction histidine kinase/DNA-binding response OmpR family regulator